MDWFGQTTHLYLNWCWPRSATTYGFTRPQCVGRTHVSPEIYLSAGDGRVLEYFKPICGPPVLLISGNCDVMRPWNISTNISSIFKTDKNHTFLVFSLELGNMQILPLSVITVIYWTLIKLLLAKSWILSEAPGCRKAYWLNDAFFSHHPILRTGDVH